MKHVFVIGSHTPFLTSLGVIQHLELTQEEVVFVLGRNYRCDLLGQAYTKFDISDKYYIYLKGNTNKRIREHEAWLDQFIETHIGEPFVLYEPHLCFMTFQILATHPLCKDVKFIQEGIADFTQPEPVKRKISWKDLFIENFLTRGTRIWMNQCWNDTRGLKDKKVSETFAITDKLFQNMHCKHTIVSWPVVDTQLKLDPQATFFVFESLVEQKNIEKEIFMAATRALIRKFGGKMNYVKYHPYQTQANINEINQIFHSLGFQVQNLPGDVPFELILCSETKYKICGFTTSLVFFASLLGHEAHICVPALYGSKKFMTYWRRYEKQLQCYGNVFNYEDL